MAAGCCHRGEIVQLGSRQAATISYRVTVDTTRNFGELVADGHYAQTFVNEEQWDPENRGQVERDLILFDLHGRYAESSEEVLRLMGEFGLVPADSTDLLAFGAAFPEAQEGVSIVALGSTAVINGVRAALLIGADASGRGLSTISYHRAWYGGCCFLARKGPERSH